MRRTLVLLGFAVMVAARADADVRLTIQNGRVTLNATNATLPQILTEWARVGQTRIVNAEKAVSAPLTLQLDDVPEEQALDVILRSMSGYIAAPRAIQNPGASRFDRIVLLAISSPVRPTGSGPSPTLSFVQPQPVRQNDQEQNQESEQDGNEQRPNFLPPNVRLPNFLAPPPQPDPPPATGGDGPAGSYPPSQPRGGVAIGVSRPGMIAAPPQPSPAPAGGNPLGPFMPVGPGGQAPTGVSVPGMIIPAPSQPGSPVPPEDQAP